MKENFLAIGIDAKQAGFPMIEAGSANFDNIVNVVYMVIAAVALFYIVFGAFKFVTSSGNASNVTSARNTILYAVIGLLTSTLVFSILKFIAGKL